MPKERDELRAADRIRATAADMFYQHGIRAVGVDELVERAGATKPSLYRSYESKDALVLDYLQTFAAGFWERFEAALAAHPGDPRAQLLELFTRSARRIAGVRYRGCALSNAAVEYPLRSHLAHRLSMRFKSEVRRRLGVLADGMGAGDPALLADGLFLLLEGAYGARQMLGSRGPSNAVAVLAQHLIDSWPRRDCRL
jgi:AcrR family transcriptional regulator